ncbi:hypothetical protein [Candidatus Poriferisodalis sp.]|uniref:hypothetical protein n=1 Tax=Candidatus Poriferisodalis sp. TaxID=3101277 RepID=UPI003AF65BAA
MRAANEWMREHRKGLTKATTLMDPATGAAFKAIIDDMAQRFAQAERNDWTPPQSAADRRRHPMACPRCTRSRLRDLSSGTRLV